jgi:hypothetical protein
LPVVKDLRAEVDDGKVRLIWTLPADAGGVAGFVIERSKPEKDICPGCPRDFEEIGTVPAERGPTSFEAKNLPGKGRFSYRVTPYDAKGRKGTESNEVAVASD